MSENKKEFPKNEDTSSPKEVKQQGSAAFDKLIKEAEADTETRKPGSSGGNQSNQNNNGRGGGN